ncbi:TPA: protease [Candidatus Saccharibacteria bacterium]|nr:protease [Candidatus Saccharibacteria bacterium]HIO87515.1 protease [Candidatus Saccharibacteria bacterium]
MYSKIAENKRKTVYLVLGLFGLIILIGYVISVLYDSPSITLFVGVGAVIYTLFNYYAADKVALSISRAKQVDASSAPRLYKTVENLTIATGMPMPKVYIMNDPAPNAFATGRDPDHASVAATTGLLDMLSDSELEGVMAHELSHVANYDIRVTTIVFGMFSVISLISDFFLRSLWWGGGSRDRNNNGVTLLIGIGVSILAAMVASLIRMAVSRQREYLADASGVMMTRYPDGLASALQKIGSYSRPTSSGSSATAHMFFENPLKKTDKNAGFIANLFSTHPPIAKRIERINQAGTQL